METIFSEKATSIYVKFDNRDDFSKISIGADFSGEIGPKRFGADFSRGRFLQGPISPAFDQFRGQELRFVKMNHNSFFISFFLSLAVFLLERRLFIISGYIFSLINPFKKCSLLI